MAYRNVSNSEKTIKNIHQMGSSDSWELSRVTMFMKYQKNTIFPYYNILDNYRDYFDKHLVEVEVDEKFFYSPTSFADYYYGDSLLDWLVLYFARISTLFDFNKKRIKVLPVDYMNEVNQIIVKYRSEVTENNNHPIEFK